MLHYCQNGCASMVSYLAVSISHMVDDIQLLCLAFIIEDFITRDPTVTARSVKIDKWVDAIELHAYVLQPIGACCGPCSTALGL